jgi:hypothetical protein
MNRDLGSGDLAAAPGDSTGGECAPLYLRPAAAIEKRGFESDPSRESGAKL